MPRVILNMLMLFLTLDLTASDKSERKLLSHDQPEYPQLAKGMNLHGTVKLRVWVRPDGSVRRLEYIGGHPLLAESALKTVKSWTYVNAEHESTELVELKF
jgi:TonB family protein